MSYSVDLRKRVIAYHMDGHTLEETSNTFQVSIAAICEWKKMLKEKGDLAPKELHRTFKKIDPTLLRQYVDEQPDAYQSELAEKFSCSVNAVCKALKREHITLKKRLRDTKNKTPKK